MSEQEMKELKEQELEEISAGIKSYPDGKPVYIHRNCGGQLQHVGELFSSVTCTGCTEVLYLLKSFDYDVIYR